MIKVAASFLAILAVVQAAPGFQPAAAYSTGVVTGAAPVAYAGPQLAYGAAPAVAKVHHAAPAVAVAKTVVADDYDPNPQYNYGYSVQDGLTGDSKGHQESRSGDVVQGQYSLVEPDGAVRTVTYTSDPVNGFNAVVDRSAPAAPVVAKVHAPAVYASQPVLKTHHF